MVRGSVLDLKLDRPAAAPADAATMIIVRNADDGVEVFCVERSKKSRFLGGAIVFPGGKLDEADSAETWTPLVTTTREPARAPTTPFARDEGHLRAGLRARPRRRSARRNGELRPRA